MKMPTIRLSDEVKEKLDDIILKEILKEAENPKVLIKALKNRHGYTHSEFIGKMIVKWKTKA